MKHPVLVFLFSLSLVTGAMAQSTEKAAYEEVVQYEAKVDKQAMYPGGSNGVMLYILKHILHLQEALRAGAQGRVFIKFTVGIKGKVNKVEVLRTDNKRLANEVTNIFDEMEKWTPAYLNDQPVEVSYVFPVKFKLDQ